MLDQSLFKILDKNHRLEDERLTCVRDTDTEFPWPEFTTLEALKERKEELRFNLRMAAGLYPWPERTPMDVKYEDVGDYDGYSLKKIMFETRPGFWSTGNLYLPKPLKAPAAAILNLIGHWPEQRLTRRQTGGEEADYPQQIANFARMGFVCLVTDMVGKVDSQQIHHWYGDNKANDLWLSNSLGVQLWNNIRALDLLCSMPEVDGNRIGATGASGGGTQSLLLSLIDERIRAVAPINMISLHMQGGCQCENAPGLRRHTTNPEMCAALAPVPLFLAGSTGDWTKNQETVEVPIVKQAYALYGMEDRVEHFFQEADHQYNAKTRHHVYSFFARHLQGREIVWEEQPIETGDLQDFTWFRGEGRAPGIKSSAEFLAVHKIQREEQRNLLDREERLRMLSWITGITERTGKVITCSTAVWNGCKLEKGLLGDGAGVQIPYAKLIPENWDGKKVCLMLDGKGKECLSSVKAGEMLEEGIALVSGDLFMTGEFLQEDAAAPANRAVKFMTCFHYTDDLHRVQDVALLLDYARTLGGEAVDLRLWAENSAAYAAACALPLYSGVKEAGLDKTVFSLKEDEDYITQFFAPGLSVLGGLKGILELIEADVTFI